MKTLGGVVSIVTASFALLCFAADVSAAVAFSPRVDYASTNPASIAKGDLNNDGRTDLVAANWSADTITVFLGNSDGTFTAQTPVSTGGVNSHPNSIATGHFNNDTNLDLAVANGGGIRDVAIMLGDGSGGFSSVTSLDVSVGGYPTGDADINFIVSGDFDNDGETDLALSKNTGYQPTINDQIKIMKGDGSGGFTPLSSTNVGDSATGPFGLATGYFNDDANLDLAVTMYDSGTLKIFLGTGTGGLTEASGSPITVGTIPLHVVNADLNGDGEADLIVTNYTSNTLSVLLGNGDGTFTAASGSPLSAGTNPNGLAAALIDADDNVDLIVANTGASTFSVFAGKGDGTFQARQDFATAAGPGFLAAGNFDGDGKTDIVIANSSGNTISVFLQTECTPPPSGMVSWWGGDNNALDMVGTNNGTVNEATYAAGMVGQAFSFDGVDDYVEVPDSSNLSFAPTSSLTIYMWAYPTAGGTMHLIGKRGTCWDAGQSANYQIAHDSTNGFSFSSAGQQLLSGQQLLTNQWQHVAVTADGSTFRLYIDGQEKGSVAGTLGAQNSGAPVIIGGVCPGVGATFPGLLDEVAIVNRALTAEEIVAIYNAGSGGTCRQCTSPPSEMVSWWQAEDNAEDIAGGYTGTLQGNATYAAGKVGQAFIFDGAGDFVDAGNDPVFNFNNGLGDFTMDAWIYLAAYNPEGSGIVAKASQPAGFLGWRISVDGTGKLSYEQGNGDQSGAIGTIGTISLDAWTHVAVTSQDPGQPSALISLYINGQLDNLSGGIVASLVSVNPLRIGTITATSGFFTGLIDEVEIFSRGLSADEIAKIYNAGSAGKCSYSIGTNSPANGAIVCDSLVAGGYDGLCTMTPDTGYYLSALTDNGDNVLGSVTGGTYTISNITGVHDVVATFALYPVWRDGTPDYFMTLGDAYGDGGTAYTIKAHGAELTDSNLILAGTADMIIDGGYLADFSGYSGIPTTITGPLTIGGTGSVAVSNIAVR